MEIHKIVINYQVYESEKSLPAKDSRLLQAAHDACDKSYAPYSKFHVGAAVRLDSGEILSGANQENAAYPICLCAERVVLAAVSSMHPKAKIRAMAITVYNPRQIIEVPGTPCGACRQALSEKEDEQGQSIRIILQGETGPIYCFNAGKDLLPLAFGGDML